MISTYHPNPNISPTLAWDNIPDKIKDILIDLRYRGDYNTITRLYLQRLAYEGDLDGFGKMISDRSTWFFVPKIGLKEELISMKIINIVLIGLVISLNVSAAFTEPELSQLEDINKRSIKKTENSKRLLDKKIKETISNLPEQKKDIINLNKSWNETIKKKCHLLIFESLNTDAEIAMENQCLSNEYLSEMNFFERLNQ